MEKKINYFLIIHVKRLKGNRKFNLDINNKIVFKLNKIYILIY